MAGVKKALKPDFELAKLCLMAQISRMTEKIFVKFNGAAGTVTGSCMLFSWHSRKILVDCGMFQGSRTLEKLNYEDFSFAPSEIDALILTHAHIDHSGLFPKLVKDGFRGQVFCTHGTRDLLEFMLADSGRIHEADAERRNRRPDRDENIEPLYTELDALKAWNKCTEREYETWFEVTSGIKAKFWNAGHILGSASVELDINGVKILCSGDLGPDNKIFHPDPEAPNALDYVIGESTYGTRDREDFTIAQRRTKLETEINEALKKGGNLIIPVFALERTQELMLDIAELKAAGRIGNINVFIDSPLASKATKAFDENIADLEDISNPNIFKSDIFHFTDDVEMSKRLNNLKGAIIMAASGMCEAGRIRHHLRHNLPDANSTVLFVGYQAGGSLGRMILDGAQKVRISGQDVLVRAKIRKIDGYSAHADQGELLAWIKERNPILGSLFLTHGEKSEIEIYRDLVLKQNPGLSILIPEIGEEYLLSKKSEARRTKTGRIDLFEALNRDWENEYTDFSLGLKSKLLQIKDETERKKVIKAMQDVLKANAIN